MRVGREKMKLGKGEAHAVLSRFTFDPLTLLPMYLREIKGSAREKKGLEEE